MSQDLFSIVESIRQKNAELERFLAPYRKYQDIVRRSREPYKKTLDAIDRWKIPQPKNSAPPSYYLPEPEPVKPPVINLKAKPPEQRSVILQEIAYRGWSPLAIPDGGVEDLTWWFSESFGKSKGVFRDRWQELRRLGRVETENKRGRKSSNSESIKNNDL